MKKLEKYSNFLKRYYFLNESNGQKFGDFLTRFRIFSKSTEAEKADYYEKKFKLLLTEFDITSKK